MKKVLVAFFCIFSVSATAQTVIRGIVTDGNGRAPIQAGVHLGQFYGNMHKSLSYPCTAKGTFQLHLSPGIYEMRVSAVNQEEASFPLVVRSGDKNIDFRVQLKPNSLPKTIGKVFIVGDWNEFDFATADTMTPTTLHGKTIYSYTRKASGDTLAYQLLGVAANSHSVNGTQADYFAYDGGGDYRSVLRATPGKMVTITFDPSKWNYTQNDALPKVDVENDPFLQKAIAVSAKADAMYSAARAFPGGGGPATMSASKYQELIDYMKSNIDQAKASGDSELAQFEAVALAGEYSGEDTAFGANVANLILRTVPSSSPFWAMEPMYASLMMGLADSTQSAMYLHGLENNPENIVRAYAVGDEMEDAFQRKDDARGNALYGRLKQEYGDVSQIKYLLDEYDPESPTKVGKHVPPFSVTLLDGAHVSDTSMLGKYYMIDFWATWCGPCVGEMPSLHKAYARFKGKKGFEILSLSMDGMESQIPTFRKKWPMPWLNAFTPGVFDGSIAKEFEIAFIPNPILVGPDGTILAKNDSLRGEELEKTLGKFLGESD
ncbi:MAG TPA: thioredoxin-like domain-containing protein [Candidatus Kapabacteria bacterium]|nr:thioredoxin-like domain-containing protein [Candidatus Kapabacteria bacterium]